MYTKKIVIIPSDPIAAYEAKGTSSWLKDYYNPKGYFDEVYILSPLEKIKYEKYGLKVIPVANSKDYKKKLKSINPLCVRSYGGYWATDYAVFNKVKNIPIVSSVHDTNPKNIHSSLKYSDFIISMSEIIEKKLINEGLAIENRIKVLGNRVDTSIFKPYAKNNEFIQNIRSRFPEGKMILHVGRKSFQKNIDTVLKSLMFLSEDYFVVFIGKGDISQYEDIIEINKLKNRVFWLESVKNYELPYWYNAADVFCVPSRWEGFGLVFIEAAACKAKIITSNIAPLNEYLFNDEEMCFLVDDYEKPDILALTIKKAIQSNSYNEKLSVYIKNKFDKEQISNKEIVIYNNVFKLNSKFTFSYYVWRISYILSSYVIPFIKRLPKRIWRKIS